MVCPKCASPVVATDHFCENCGSPLGGAVATVSPFAPQVCQCPPGQSKPDADGYCQVCGVRCVTEAVAARKHVEISVDTRLAVVSDVGHRHPINEDAGVVARTRDGAVVLVIADGVSSATDSASASQMAIEVVLATLLAAPTDADSAASVQTAIVAANEAVIALPFAGGEADGPETTIVVALCRGGNVTIGWAGDSRAYLLGTDTVEPLTVDDSWVEEAVRRGELTSEEAKIDKRAHYVTQVLGMRDQPLDVHVRVQPLPPDSVLLLCSDGLWNYFQEAAELADAVRHCNPSDALSLCRCLVTAANQHGGHDNITVAVSLGDAREHMDTSSKTL